MNKIIGKVAILGAGNIGLSIAEGIFSSITGQKIILTRKTKSFSKKERERFKCTINNQEAVLASEILIIAVQPKQARDLLLQIKKFLNKKHLLVSVVSGMSIDEIEKLVGKMPIVRVMTNTAIRIGQSMTCIAFNDTGKKYRDLVEDIFGSVGSTLLIPETKFAEATVVCGSGTALALRFIRDYMQACIQHGFDGKDSLKIASQVLKGAASITQDNRNHPEVEIDKVTTPGGCTIEALAEMEHAGFSSALLRVIKVGVEKAKKLYS